MLLRDETQMAMNQVETLCFESADYYAGAADRAGEQDLAGLFNELAGQHRTLAAALAQHIHALDDLPQQPDPDREAVSEMFSGIKAFLSGDARRTLIEEGLQYEERLTQAVSAALRQDLPVATQEMLRRVQGQAEVASRELVAARG